MNKYQLYTLGGALLAATSLSGAAQAGSVGNFNNATNVFTAGSLKIGNTAISGTAATANAQTVGGGTSAANLGVLFSNNYSNTFDLYITIPVTGASFVGTPVARYLINAYNAGVITLSATTPAATLNAGLAPTISALGNQIFISNVQVSGIGSINGFNQSNGSLFIGGVVLEGVSFTNVAGLATAGGTITLGATVASQSNQAQIYETVTPAAVVTSVAPLTTTIAAATAASVAVGTGTTQFTTITGGGVTITLANIAITGTGALGTDLSTPVSPDGSVVNSTAASDGINVVVTSPALSDPAAVSVTVLNNVGGTAYSNVTVANFSGGSATFSLSNTATTYTGSLSVTLTYSGTTAISAAAAGTASLTYSIGTGSSVVAPASASGATTVVSRSGLNTQVNWANSGSGSGFTSYLRIHNSGNVAATASIVVKQDTLDGSAISTVGTYTTPTLPAGGTIQVSVPTIETSLGVTANAAHSYTLLISGAFPGYVQHLSLAANGSLVDLDGFRSAGVTTP
ncbi:MAG: hypothetical protein EPO08_15175 [Rhodospirillaceae bacterium]|nr:MAG: hypothetical protein EPO08_15175 [Rhodospirillaceae bacterium]